VHAKAILLITLLPLLTGCLFYPVRTATPVNIRVVDAETGKPIAGAHVLRIVCDVHDLHCQNGRIDRSQTDNEGFVKVAGETRFGFWAPGPGGIPVPSNQIAIWKEGYYALVFSQFGDIQYIEQSSGRKDIIEAINEIPLDRKFYGRLYDFNEVFSGGQAKLYRKIGSE